MPHEILSEEEFFDEFYADVLEKGLATHSSILSWRISWTEEPGGLQSMGLQRVRHNWVTNTHADSLFECPSNMCVCVCVCVVSEDDSFSEYHSDSDDVNIRPAKRQKTLMIDSDKEIENELHNAGECYFASAEE